jgi:hypothetical protein
MFNPVLAEQSATEHVAELHRAAAERRRTTAAGRRQPTHRVRTQVTAWRVRFATAARPRAVGCEV